MKRSFTLILLSVMLSIKALSQSQCGLQEYYYLGAKQAFIVVPIVYFQNRHNWYFEGRYNYEAANTLSVYAGKIFEKKGNISCSVNPVAGLVTGELKGGSAGMNIKVDYKKCSFSSQSQYTFSFFSKKENFIYSWSELSYNPTDFLGGGLCLQQTREFDTKNRFDKGIFLKIKCSRWTFPLYVFEKSGHEKYFVLSLNYEWTHTGVLRNKNNSNH